MKQTIGKVLSIKFNVSANKRDGGSYNAYQVVYEANGKVDTLTKAMASLERTPSIKEALEALKAGDTFIMEQEKNAKGFLDVISIAKGDESDIPAVSKETAPRSQGQARVYQTDKQYETAKERAQRQLLIVRQSCLAQAVEAAVGNVVTAKDLLKTAEKFEEWVFRGQVLEHLPISVEQAAAEVE